MIDVNKPVREAFVAVLDGTITYEGAPVPCYHLRDPEESERPFILLHTQTGENNSNKGANEIVGTMLVDVVQHVESQTTTSDAVDTIANEVKQLLEPTVTGHGLTHPAGLQIWNLQWLSDTDLPLYSDEGNVMRRAMRYEYKVNVL